MMAYARPQSRRGSQSVKAYANIGLETKVNSASAEELISLLFDAALAAIATADLHIKNGNIEGRGLAISKAIDIVDSGLKASVDTSVGGDLAKNLIAAYELAIRHLLLANLNADASHLDIAKRLLGDLGEAWHNIADARKP